MHWCLAASYGSINAIRVFSSEVFNNPSSHRHEAVQCVHELGPGEWFDDHLICPAGQEEVDILGKRIASYS